MVMHETPERAFYAALEELAKLDFMRAHAARDPRDRGGVRQMDLSLINLD